MDIINPFDHNTVGVEHIGDKTIYHYAQDESAICNQNEIDRREGNFDNGGEFRKTASVPMVVWNLWESMGITTDQKALRKQLMKYKERYMTTERNLI